MEYKQVIEAPEQFSIMKIILFLDIFPVIFQI